MSTQGRPPSGYTTWRSIADEIRESISAGEFPAGAKLPSESELAERFAVHRHTVRRAIAAITSERLVQPRRGSGTFVVENPVLVHRIGLRTRLSESVGPGGPTLTGTILETVDSTCPPQNISDQLALDGAPATRWEVVRRADGQPIARSTIWLRSDLADALLPHLGTGFSVTRALQSVGIRDYLRATTTVSARGATIAEASDLEVPPGSVVIVVRSLDTRADQSPLLAGITRFVADRVELEVVMPEG